ncbi:MAG: alpha/beta hydrolase, partial [Pseudomonadota bacterium]
MNGSGPTSQTFISQRLRLNYLDWAKGRDRQEKPPLVLIHGGRDHARSWDWTARALSEEYRVFAMDHRGHGDSDWVSDGNYGVTDMVYDVAQFVHQLGCGPVRMIAHSM